MAKPEQSFNTKQESKEISAFDQEAKKILFDELNVKGNLSKETVLNILGYKSKEWELNFSAIEGNRTNQDLYKAYLKMMELEDEEIDLSKFTASDPERECNIIF
ncbi:MAG: hypothetical protein WDO19_13430 [Bacteroidota bacterium]